MKIILRFFRYKCKLFLKNVSLLVSLCFKYDEKFNSIPKEKFQFIKWIFLFNDQIVCNVYA